MFTRAEDSLKPPHTIIQLCGLGHATMRGFVTVHTAEEFQSRMDAEEAKLAEQGQGDAVWN